MELPEIWLRLTRQNLQFPAEKRPRSTVIAFSAVFVALIFAFDIRAQETTDSDWYISTQIPVMFLSDIPKEVKSASRVHNFGAETVTEFSKGFRLSGTVGYQINPNWRFDGELFIGRADVNNLTYRKMSCSGNLLQAIASYCSGEIRDTKASGSSRHQGFMASIWYDRNSDSKWTPYIGAGIGFLKVDIGGASWNPSVIAGEIEAKIPDDSNVLLRRGTKFLSQLPLPRTSTSDTALAYQFGLGMGYQRDESTTLFMGYRYQSTGNMKFMSSTPATLQLGPDNVAKGAITVNSETKVRIQFLEFGIRKYF